MATKDVRAAMGVAAQNMRRRPNDPPPGEARRIDGVEVGPGEWTTDFWGLPPECPVTPLGMEGVTIHLMDSLGQLVSLEPSAFGAKMIQALFGERQNFLWWAWPRFQERKKQKGPPIPVGWRPEQVTECLYTAAARRGLFSPRDRVRGRGAWLDKQEALIWHSGAALYRPDKTRKNRGGGVEYVAQDTGDVGEFFYPRKPETFAPWPEEIEDNDNPAVEILQMLRRWNWERPEVDPVLFLGWLGAALLGGALEWRPSLFVTADAASGKSSLQKFARSVLGSCLLESVDTTVAGIYQTVAQDSLPVGVDELEAEADSRKAMGVIKLARLAAGGGKMRRGGSEHDPVQFEARSCFIFTAINAPPMEPADASRMGRLRLRALDIDASGEKSPTLLRPETIGPRLLRRMMDGFAGLGGRLAEYRAVLRAAGHDGRSQDTLGTLLACADLALGAECALRLEVPMYDSLAQWGEWLPAPERMPNWLGCLRHLMSARVEAWRTGAARSTIGKVLEDLIDEEGMSGAEKKWSLDEESENRLDFKRAASLLAQAGVGLVRPGKLGDARPEEGFLLAIPNESPKLMALFRDTKWVGVAGASVWKDALRQGPAEIFVRGENRVRIDGTQLRCVVVKVGIYWKGEW